MAFWLAEKRTAQNTDWIGRFDPRFWTVNFPRPMIACITTPAPDTLRVEATFRRKGDLAGIIWDSEDTLDHPLLAYDTVRDYAHSTLSFRWRSAGVIALDAPNGPTLTIEGRDASGAERSWFVRLWNYAAGSPEDAVVTLPFSALAGGWAADDPVHPSDIDRMFISLVPPAYAEGDGTPLSEPVDGWAELSAIAVDGAHACLRIGDVHLPPLGIACATGYDDAAGQAPARLVRQIEALGYRGSALHYVGMSHYPRLVETGGAYLAGDVSDPLSAPARSWHREYFTQLVAAGFSPIASLSYELFAQYCPDSWKQRAHDGSEALTGWIPPSTLLSPANANAMAWLQAVAASFVDLMVEAGAEPRFQVGEPWWWVTPDRKICLYDDEAIAAFGGSPPVIADLSATLDPSQLSLLDNAGAVLSASTIALAQAARDAAAPRDCETLLLPFLPTVLDPATPEARRANLPTGWAAPAFDRLQLEDYDWLTSGADALRREGYAIANTRLLYPPDQQDYLAGFVLTGDDAQHWHSIDRGIEEARSRHTHEVFVWALPQIARDGFVRLPPAFEDTDMRAFDDVSYPLALGRNAVVMPEFSTSVAMTASGHERRNALWSDALLRFDVGPGIRSEDELGTLLAFFRARRGAARGFRMRDPSDFSSSGMTGEPSAIDQVLGTGDGTLAEFALVKNYGEPGDDEPQSRRITRPDAASVRVALDGVELASGWTLDPLGLLVFDTAPPDGAIVTAGFTFDVPVRFAEDRLELAGASFAAGEAPSVPILEIREAS